MDNKTCLNCEHWEAITDDVIALGLCAIGKTVYPDGQIIFGVYTTAFGRCKKYLESIDTKFLIKENSDNL